MPLALPPSTRILGLGLDRIVLRSTYVQQCAKLFDALPTINYTSA